MTRHLAVLVLQFDVDCILFGSENVDFTLYRRSESESLDLRVIARLHNTVEYYVLAFALFKNAFYELETLVDVVENILDLVHLLTVGDLSDHNRFDHIPKLFTDVSLKGKIGHSVLRYLRVSGVTMCLEVTRVLDSFRNKLDMLLLSPLFLHPNLFIKRHFLCRVFSFLF